MKALLIAAAAATVFCAAGLNAGPARAQDKWDRLSWIDGQPITLRAGYNTVKQYPHGRAIERFAHRIAERTGENVQIQTFPSETLGSEQKMLEAIVAGNLDMAKVSTGLLTGFVPEFGVFDLPYIFRDVNHMMKVINGPIGKQLAQKLESRNIKLLFWMEQGTRSIYTRAKPVKSLADLNGLKIRTIQSPIMADTISALGARPTPMPFGELYMAMKSGVVDGAENAPDALWYSKQYEVTKYYTLTDHFITPVVFLMNKEKFDSLPKQYQEILTSTSSDVQGWAGELYSNVATDLLKKLKDAGVTVYSVDKEPFRKAAQSVLTKYSGRYGELLKQIEATQ
jgi:tripartite ATP-independent transporter DctP family solute receptor